MASARKQTKLKRVVRRFTVDGPAVDLVAGGGVLPDQVFFEPTPTFVKWFTTQLWHRYRRVVDVGAGKGRLSRVLMERGLDTLAIDIHQRPEYEHKVELQDGTRFEFDTDDICIVARPCHGTGFAEIILRRAVDHSALAYYIGLARNIKSDLGEELHWTLVKRRVGRDGENLYQVLGKRKDLKDFVQVKLEGWKDFSWMKDDGHWYRFDSGGGFPKKDSRATLGKKIRAMHFDQLPREETWLDEKLHAGWITPDGRWLGCHSRNHDNVLYYLLGIRLQRAERIGFVRCYGEYMDKMLWTRPDKKRITPRQKALLEEHGYNVEDWQMDLPADVRVGT